MPSARTRTPKPAAAQTEVRRFGMHPKLLLDVIKRQAGSLAKAILEGVMNSIDAGAKICTVEIWADRVVITDDGRGITERAQVEQFFETFGQPHDESEGKVYGTFRMGRGQMFAYGRNKWLTGPFTMSVDVKERGLDYELATGPVTPGCSIVIDLYDPLLPGDLADTERTIRKWVQYAPGRVVVNAKQANVDPAKEKWDVVTEDAYVRLSGGSGSLALYNLGVHVMDFAGHRLGTGGTVVSRKQLRVNFARNDVQSDCPVWKKLKPLIDQRARDRAVKKTDLTEDERRRMCHLVAIGEPPPNAYDLRLFTTVNGRHYSAEQLIGMNYKYNRKLAEAPKGHRVGDKVFQQCVACVLAVETAERFDTDLAGLVKLLKKMYRAHGGHPWPDKPAMFEVVPFKDVAAGISETYDLVPDAEYTPIERMWVDLAARITHVFNQGAAYEDRDTRRVLLGRSETADGWTDGTTFVAIDRAFLKTLAFDVQGITDLGLLMLHEFCHDGPDTAEHTHSQEFYEAFHDRAWTSLPAFVAGCLGRLPTVLQSAGRSLPKALLRNADEAEKTKRALRALLKIAEATTEE